MTTCNNAINNGTKEVGYIVLNQPATAEKLQYTRSNLCVGIEEVHKSGHFLRLLRDSGMKFDSYNIYRIDDVSGVNSIRCSGILAEAFCGSFDEHTDEYLEEKCYSYAYYADVSNAVLVEERAIAQQLQDVFYAHHPELEQAQEEIKELWQRLDERALAISQTASRLLHSSKI